jgi:hypothetical protein
MTREPESVWNEPWLDKHVERAIKPYLSLHSLVRDLKAGKEKARLPAVRVIEVLIEFMES